MNRSTVISMVQDLTEHKADQRLDFNNLFNLRLVKFIQEKPFWWRKKIFSFVTQPGVALYDFSNLQPQTGSWALTGGGTSVNVVAISSNVAPPPDLIAGSQIILSECNPAEYNGGPFGITTAAGDNAFFNQPAGYVPDGLNLISGIAKVYVAPQVLATDVESFLKAELWLGGQKLGNLEPDFDIESISDAQEISATGTPSAYCIEPGTLTTLRLMDIPDQAYKAKFPYWACPQPGDDYSDDAIPLIPAMYHHGLVSGLKMDVAGFLYGEKSSIYNVAVGEYQESITKAVARQDISAEKNLQFIVREDSVRSVTGN